MNAPAGKFEPVDQAEVAWLGTEPIPAKPYYEAEWFELERRAVFLRSWIVAGHVCEVPEPGSFIRREFEFAGVSLLIVRGKDKLVRAFHNVCTHRGTQLVTEAEGKRATFSCPYHMWTYGSEGALLSAPDFDGFALEKKDCALKQVAVAECGGLLFINFDKEPVPLREWLGDFADRMDELPCARAVTFSEYTYEIEANWKLTYDNFQENYHLRFIHPRSGEAAISPDNPFGYPKEYGFCGPHRTQVISSNPDAKPSVTQALAMQKGIEAGMKADILSGPHGRRYFALFPNFFIIGTPIQHFGHVVYPISATRSRGVIRLYWANEDQTPSERFAREFMTAQLRDIHAEDRSVIEAGQRGLSSGALEHIHFQTQEVLCRHLYKSVEAAVRGWQAEQRA